MSMRLKEYAVQSVAAAKQAMIADIENVQISIFELSETFASRRTCLVAQNFVFWYFLNFARASFAMT